MLLECMPFPAFGDRRAEGVGEEEEDDDDRAIKGMERKEQDERDGETEK